MKASSKAVSAVARAVWLTELAKAIDEAQRLAWRLGVIEGRTQALDLYVQLEIARAEVEALRERGTLSRAAGEPGAARLFPNADIVDLPES